MILSVISWTVLFLAALPCGLFLWNWTAYRRPPRPRPGVDSSVGPAVSVLIPARNEEQNLGATLAAVLASRQVNLEVIVLDDGSTDETRSIAEAWARKDRRLRVESAPPLPADWCGKPHACQCLAGLARHRWLVFLDADVRLQPEALASMVTFMTATEADLASGVPRQETITFSEQLLLPLIHFILLCFLPLRWARRTGAPAYGAGCGQLFIARAQAYAQAGGHRAVRATLHDGLQLPRAFRRAGLRTDLFDVTDLATCRMYRSNGEVWRGLSRNATEGLAAPGTIGPMSLLLLGGQVAPLLVCWLAWGRLSAWLAASALALSYLPRLVGLRRFRQSLLGACLHPLGTLALVGIQWWAFFRKRCGQPALWKGRAYGAQPQTRAREGRDRQLRWKGA